MRCLCLTLLICIGLAPIASSAQFPSPASYVFKLHGFSHPVVYMMRNDAGTDDDQVKISGLTYGGIAATHVAGAAVGYSVLKNVWGSSDGRFHLKNETGDHLAFNDEISHLFVGYKLTQGFKSAYRGLGFSNEKARTLGMIESALVMTAVEFPVDAYNPTQGLGITDLVADYIGIGLAYWKDIDPRLSNFDIKVSVKSISANNGRALGYNNEDYDNYIYWLTYRYRFAVVGAGYSTGRTSPVDPQPQMFLGIGTTIPDLCRPISSKLADRLKPLELYFFNFNLKAL